MTRVRHLGGTGRGADHPCGDAAPGSRLAVRHDRRPEAEAAAAAVALVRRVGFEEVERLPVLVDENRAERRADGFQRHRRRRARPATSSVAVAARPAARRRVRPARGRGARARARATAARGDGNSKGERGHCHERESVELHVGLLSPRGDAGPAGTAFVGSGMNTRARVAGIAFRRYFMKA